MPPTGGWFSPLWIEFTPDRAKSSLLLVTVLAVRDEQLWELKRGPGGPTLVRLIFLSWVIYVHGLGSLTTNFQLSAGLICPCRAYAHPVSDGHSGASQLP